MDKLVILALVGLGVYLLTKEPEAKLPMPPGVPPRPTPPPQPFGRPGGVLQAIPAVFTPPIVPPKSPFPIFW